MCARQCSGDRARVAPASCERVIGAGRCKGRASQRPGQDAGAEMKGSCSHARAAANTTGLKIKRLVLTDRPAGCPLCLPSASTARPTATLTGESVVIWPRPPPPSAGRPADPSRLNPYCVRRPGCRTAAGSAPTRSCWPKRPLFCSRSLDPCPTHCVADAAAAAAVRRRLRVVLAPGPDWLRTPCNVKDDPAIHDSESDSNLPDAHIRCAPLLGSCWVCGRNLPVLGLNIVKDPKGVPAPADTRVCARASGPARKTL